MNKKRQKLRGTVQKVIKPIVPGQVEKAEIDVKGADPLYREIRIENVVVDVTSRKFCPRAVRHQVPVVSRCR
jgi:hypothetical protein